MQRVLVVDKNEKPLMPCQPARARHLLKQGKAAVYRKYPFTIILKERNGGETQPLQVKIDPGSKTTGIAMVAAFKRGLRCIWAAELTHRGQQIRDALFSRRQSRRSRRSRTTRYRQPRFLNRRRAQGWLPPSLQSRVDNLSTWVKRLRRFSPVTHLAMELTRFDTQRMENPEISGVEYQQGTLQGYEVREYLLEKWGRKCAYCGAENVPLEVEHLDPKSRGGSDRVSNLALACRVCNEKKGNQTAAEFGYPELEAQAQQPLKDAAAVNGTRWALYARLKLTGLPIEIGTGARSKFNRMQQKYPKTHWLDAVCVGESGAKVFVPATLSPLRITARGRGSRQMCRVDQYGFPRTKAKQFKRVHGFQSGDMVKAVVTQGKKVGTYIGRVAIRASGRFNIQTPAETVQGIHYIYCQAQHRSDGYAYSFVAATDESPGINKLFRCPPHRSS